MKILHLIPTYKPAYVYGGPVYSVSLLCENLAKAGHRVRVLATTANGEQELEVPAGKPQMVDGVEVFYFHRWTKGHSHFSPGLLWQMWKDCGRFDVVHIHSWWNLPVMLSTLICWMRGVRPVLSPRGMMSNFSFGQSHASAKHIFHRYLGRHLLRQTTFHLTSDAEASETRGLTRRHFVLPNIIQLRDDFFGENNQPPAPATSSPFTLLFLSRIHPKKNLENLLSALATMDADFRFLIAGMAEEVGYLQQLQDFAREKGLGGKVIWLGPVHEARKFEYFSSAHLFALPSFNENFANVVIEALSCGTPVLVSGEVGLSSYVRENNLGWVCNTSVEDIREKLTLIFNAGEELNAIRAKAPSVIRRDYSPATLARQYAAAYEKLIPVR